MNFHQHIASFIKRSEIIVLSEGLQAIRICDFLSFPRSLVVSNRINELSGSSQEERKLLYGARRRIITSLPLLQSDYLRGFLDISQFDALVLLNPERQTVSFANAFSLLFPGPIIVLFDSPFFLLSSKSISDCRIQCGFNYKSGQDRLVLVPRQEKTVAAQLGEEKSYELALDCRIFAQICTEMYKIIEEYVACGHDEYCCQVQRLAYADFVRSPYIFTPYELVEHLLITLYKLEFALPEQFKAILGASLAFIDAQTFPLKGFDYSFIKEQYQAITSLSETPQFTPIVKQLAEIFNQAPDIALYLPSRYYEELFIACLQCEYRVLPNSIIAPQQRRIYVANEKMHFTMQPESCRQISPQRNCVVYAPSLSLTRQLEQNMSKIGDLRVVVTPFLSNYTQASARLEYAAFKLLQTYRLVYRPERTIQLNHTVYVDIRELKSIIPIMLKARGLNVIVRSLKTADYVVSETCGIERKAASDLIESLGNQRIFYELERMQMQFKLPILLCEYSQDNNICEASSELFCGMMLKFPAVCIIWANNQAEQIANIAKQHGKRLFDIDDVKDAENIAFKRFLQQIYSLNSEERALIMSKYDSIRSLVLETTQLLEFKLGKAIAGKVEAIVNAPIQFSD